MEACIANHKPSGKSATRKQNHSVGIILGCQRMAGTWTDVCIMARNGLAVIRDGPDVRIIYSEAYETEVLQ